ncbi:MAG: hypothetical protein ACFE8Z_01565 [Candidatus Hermodarchaeota archaeon]
MGATGGFLESSIIVFWCYMGVVVGVLYETLVILQLIAYILVAIGFLGLWRKSGNIVPLLVAVFLFLQGTVQNLLFYVWYLNPIAYPDLGPDMLLQTTILPVIILVAWLLAGAAAWTLSEEFSRFAMIAALVFIVWALFKVIYDLILPTGWPPEIEWLLRIINYLVVGLYFLDAART